MPTKIRIFIILILAAMMSISLLHFSSWMFTQWIKPKQMERLSLSSSMLIPNAPKTNQLSKNIFKVSTVMKGTQRTTWQRYATLNPQSKETHTQRFLINTKGCRIPAIHPFLNGDFKYLIDRSRFKCPGPERLTMVDGDMVKLRESINKKYYNGKVDYCSLRVIRRVADSDKRVVYGPKSVFRQSNIFNGEFCIVKCYSEENKLLQTDFHSRIYVNNNVKPKLSRQNPKESLNVHLIGIDSTSRNSFIRQMPNIKKFMSRNLNAYEFPGFTKVGYNTLPNIIPLLTGKHLSETKWKEKHPFDYLDYIWKKYSAAGATTLLAEDRPRTGAFNFRKMGFLNPPTDYYIRPLTLAIASQKRHSDRCIGSMSEADYILEYTKDFLETFQDKFYFAFNFFTDWTHDDLNGASRWEGTVLEFLIWLQSTGKLNNTLLFFFSDHGFQMGDYRYSTTGEYEASLPFAYLVLPDWFKESHIAKAKALETNQKRLITSFDVYETLIENLNGGTLHSKIRRGVSLMTKISPNRTCHMAGVPLLYCQCTFKKKRIGLNNWLGRNAALVMVENMNNVLKAKAGGKCAPLTLHKLINAYKDSTQSMYFATFSVLPSNGIFESIAWLSPNTQKFEILTEAIRVNKYGNQSHCVKDLSLIMICYCV